MLFVSLIRNAALLLLTMFCCATASGAAAVTITASEPVQMVNNFFVDVSGTFSGTADTTILIYNGVNSTVLGSITSPTTYTAINIPVFGGANTLTATAVNRDGTSASASVTVSVRNPLIVMTSPPRSATFESPPSVTLQASALVAVGNIQRVDYFRTFVLGKLGSATTPPYTVVLNNLPPGTYNVFAQLVDEQGGTRPSQDITFTVTGPNQPPAVSLTSPANGAGFAAPATIPLQATATDSDGTISQVEFLQNGQLLGSTNITPYSLTVPNLPTGTYSFSARATDDRGAATTSAPVSVSVIPNNPPTVSLASTAPDAVLPAPATVTLTATAADTGGGLGRVEFYSGTTLIGTVATAPYAFVWTSIPAGTSTVTARAYNSVGGSATSAPVTVRVSADAALLVDAGIDASTVAASQVIVTGTVAAPANAGIAVNGQLAAYNRNGRFMAAVPLDPGANTLTFVLSTEAGLTASQTITVNRNGTSTLAFSADTPTAFANDQVNFTLQIPASLAFQTAEIDLDGNGTTDFTLPASSVRNGAIPFHVAYPAAGIFRVNAKLKDSSGTVVASQETVLEITTRAVLDGISRALWDKVNNALVAGDKATAMTRLTATAQAKYGPVFDTLMSQMPAIIASYSALQTGPISLDLSEYLLNINANGSNQGFFIYFVQDGDGVWRLESM